MRIHAGGRLAEGSEHVRFVPSRATGRLVFRLWANAPLLRAHGSRLDIGAVTSSGRTLRALRTDPTTLVVRLPGTLRLGRAVLVSFGWRLHLPARTGVLGRTAGGATGVRLASFYPILAWDDRSGWVTDPPTTSYAEASTSPTADYDVQIAAPSGFTVLATGARVAPGRFRARAVRDFAIAAGRFDVVTGLGHGPQPVRVTVAVERGSRGPTAQAFLERELTSLTDHVRRFGPYPWPTFSLAVMYDLGRSGIEYPNLVFQGPASLAYASSHELAHQWFYSLVGNDQERDPWLDESLATWTQARQDGILPFFTGFRVPPDAKGRLGAPMTYWDHHLASYFGGVYAQGVQALAALGDPDKVDCGLRLYVARNAYRIARPADLEAALGQVLPHARKVLDRFGVTG